MKKNGRHKDSAGGERLDLTGNWVGIASVLLFFVAYLVVMTEEFTHLRKSKPAIVDNIPVMFAVLTLMPGMPVGQWLLVTLTAGVGGSLLSIGSAACVALMGQARGVYTFFGYLKWTPAIALGYAASIGVHMTLNRSLF